MEIGPPRLASPTPGPRGSARLDDGGSSASSQSQAQAREKRAQEASTEAGAEVKRIQAEGQATAESLRENYEREALAESSRDEGALESQKLKGYEGLRDLRRSQDAQIARTRRDGDAELAKVREYYRNAVFQADRGGSQQLRETEKRDFEALRQEQKSKSAELEQLQGEKSEELRRVKEQGDSRVQAALSAERARYDSTERGVAEATERENDQLSGRYQAIVSAHEQALGQLNSEASRKLGEIRRDTAQKLAAYRERQGDPFYKLVDLSASLGEHDDRYVLRARIPDHEEKRFSVSVQGNRVLLSGTRRNEEKEELAPGHTRGTSSYQSFNEAFPIRWPVETAAITRYYDGEWLTVTLPKRDRAPAPPVQPAAPASRLRADRPAFPDNLPHTAAAPEPPRSDAPAEPAPGSRPISS